MGLIDWTHRIKEMELFKKIKFLITFCTVMVEINHIKSRNVTQSCRQTPTTFWRRNSCKFWRKNSQIVRKNTPGKIQGKITFQLWAPVPTVIQPSPVKKRSIMIGWVKLLVGPSEKGVQKERNEDQNSKKCPRAVSVA